MWVIWKLTCNFILKNLLLFPQIMWKDNQNKVALNLIICFEHIFVCSLKKKILCVVNLRENTFLRSTCVIFFFLWTHVCFYFKLVFPSNLNFVFFLFCIDTVCQIHIHQKCSCYRSQKYFSFFVRLPISWVLGYFSASLSIFIRISFSRVYQDI